MVYDVPIAESSIQGWKSCAFGVQKYKSHVWLDSIIQGDNGALDMEYQLTTPEKMDLYPILRRMARKGCWFWRQGGNSETRTDGHKCTPLNGHVEH